MHSPLVKHQEQTESNEASPLLRVQSPQFVRAEHESSPLARANTVKRVINVVVSDIIGGNIVDVGSSSGWLWVWEFRNSASSTTVTASLELAPHTAHTWA